MQSPTVVKLRFLGISMSICFFAIVTSAFSTHWFTISSSPFSILATNTSSIQDLAGVSECTTYYTASSGFICLCSFCQDLEKLHRAGSFMLLCILVSTAFGVFNIISNQLKISALESRGTPPSGVFHDDRFHVFGVFVLIIGFVEWFYIKETRHNIKQDISISVGCTYASIASLFLVLIWMHYLARVKPGYLAEINS